MGAAASNSLLLPLPLLPLLPLPPAVAAASSTATTAAASVCRECEYEADDIAVAVLARMGIPAEHWTAQLEVGAMPHACWLCQLQLHG